MKSKVTYLQVKEGKVCPKCRTTNIKGCHSMHCPYREPEPKDKEQVPDSKPTCMDEWLQFYKKENNKLQEENKRLKDRLEFQIEANDMLYSELKEENKRLWEQLEKANDIKNRIVNNGDPLI